MAAHQGCPVPGILQARTLEWVAISFSNAWKWKVKVKSLSHVWLLVTPWTAAFQAPPSMGFSRQEYWSGVPLPSPSVSSGGSQFKPAFFMICGALVWNLMVTLTMPWTCPSLHPQGLAARSAQWIASETLPGWALRWTSTVWTSHTSPAFSSKPMKRALLQGCQAASLTKWISLCASGSIHLPVGPQHGETQTGWATMVDTFTKAEVIIFHPYVPPWETVRIEMDYTCSWANVSSESWMEA